MRYEGRKIGELAKLRGGKRLPLGTSLVMEPTAHPYIRGRDIRDGRITFDDPVYVTDEVFERIKSYTVDEGEVCVTIVGNIGDVGMVPQSLSGANLTENAVKLTSLAPGCDPTYLKYALLSPECQSQMKQFAAGAAQPKLGLYKVEQIDVPFPNFTIQLRIASILSAYDDLIENNTRRIKILEEMAQAIYREWFVEFRAPGIQLRTATPEEKKLTGKDQFPKGWEMAELKTVAEVNAKSIRRDESPESIAYIDISSVGTGVVNNVDRMQFSEAPSRARRIVQHGDIIWSSVRPNRKSYSLILQPEANLVVSTGFAVLSSVSVPFTYLYEATTTDSFVTYLTNHAKGAAYPAVSAEDFEYAMLVIPSHQTLDDFHSYVEPFYHLKHVLLIRNANLRRTRDLLLPKLISGEVGVENIETQ